MRRIGEFSVEKAHIQPELFQFLRELRQNNSRDWFQENKKRYQNVLQEPLLEFIMDFRFPLKEISHNFAADARKNGGSLFRIYRDVRFSKDKTPYKTAAGIHFPHSAGRSAHAPGFYLHLEPDNCFVGVGIWHPDTKTLNKIRLRIMKESEEWTSILNEQPFGREFSQEGESLRRTPRGFPSDHPLIGELKRKDYVALRPLTEEEACREDFLVRYASYCNMGSRYVRFLTEATGFPW